MQLISISSVSAGIQEGLSQDGIKQICLCLGKVSLGLQLSFLVCLYISGRLQVT